MRLTCDEMLQSLGRWLRAAGYDTFIASGESDDELLAVCAAEARVLVTRDRRLAGRASRALLLSTQAESEHVRALTEQLGIDWTLAPFSRCLVDNAVLRPATDEEVGRMPGDTGKLPGPMRACPNCGRLYWPGSHVRRMRERLEAWSQGNRT